MKTFEASKSQIMRRNLSTASATALAVALTVSLSQRSLADEVQPPDVPTDLQVPAGNVAFLKGVATGTQNYACTPAGAGFAWVLFTPEATLFNNADKQTITHFFGPNPDPNDWMLRFFNVALRETPRGGAGSAGVATAGGAGGGDDSGGVLAAAGGRCAQPMAIASRSA